MPELALASDFPEADERDWRALVEKALRGADFERTLVSETYDGIRIEPLYTRASDKGGGSGAAIAWPEPGAAAWDVRQRHSGSDPAAVNAGILADLEGGATSIALRVGAPEQLGLPATDVAFAGALENVHLDFAAVALEPGEAFVAAAAALRGLWQARALADDKVSGGFGADPIGALARAGGLTVALDQALDGATGLAALALDRYPRVTALMADGRPYHDGGASEAQELACLCATTVAYLRALGSAGISPSDGCARIAFALAADGDQFLTIAKLRAARLLIARIMDASGAANIAGALRLHAETSARMMARRDPHVNLLRTTVACAAAAMGGADSISVLPYTAMLGGGDAFARRIARNIQIILQEESGLSHVIDPAGGSWYVESLTHEVAAKAWALFQDIERQGGMAQALATGWVQAAIRETAGKRARDVAHARQELTGVSAFPTLADMPADLRAQDLPSALDDPAVTVEPVPLRRPAEAFEALRDASDAHAARTGERAKIFLANLGRPSDHSERARYAQNLFAAGGIEAESRDGLEGPEDVASAFRQSGALLACICSSDAVYQERAETTAGALKGAGAMHVYLAGRPGDERRAYRDAGIDTFVHRGADMLEVLAEAHAVAGIEPV